uniref:PNPL.17 n=1 Tax=Nocardiopsis sp. 25L-1-1c TaxID=1009683 RepID=R4HDF3_9ACTN|nr:pNPL.17 [Nocardiopsis sp. 25L-1-1c]
MTRSTLTGTIVLTGPEGRSIMGRYVRHAAGAWADYQTARTAMEAAWTALMTTPAPLWRAAVLTLVAAHDEALTAAGEWDRAAQRVTAHEYAESSDHPVLTWVDVAGMEELHNAEEWGVEDSYPRPDRDGAVRGAATLLTEEQARRHLTLIRQTAEIIGA